MTVPDATKTLRRLAAVLRPARQCLVRARLWVTAAFFLVSAQSASGQCGGCANMSFGPAGRSFTVQSQVLSVVSADFNGDGAPDLALLGFETATLFLGNGAGTFSLSAMVTLGANSNSLAAGDVDGDGKADLVVARGSFFNVNDPGGITVLLGDGAGGIRSQNEVAAAVHPFAPVIADVNGDGKADLVIGSLAGPSSFVLAGDGSGGFGPPPPPPLPPFTGMPSHVRVADFDGDGLPDIAVASGSLLKISLGSGGGLFLPARTIALDALSYGIEILVTADFNRDGIPDLALSDHYNSAILMGAGGGDFEPPVIRQQLHIGAIGDFNQDGIPDFISSFQVFLGDGFGGIVPGPPVRLSSSSLFVVDMDSDGKDDLVVWDLWASNVDVLRGIGGGRFESAMEATATSDPVRLAAGDFNGDGRLDLAAASLGSGLAVLLNNGDGTFGPAIDAPLFSSLSWIAAVDFNGDGKTDLVATGGSSSGAAILIYAGDGTGHLGPPTLFSLPGSNAYFLVVADVNHDLKPDVVAVIDGRIAVLLNDGLGGFGSELIFGAPSGTSFLTVGDVNGDGHPDIVAQQNLLAQTYLGDGLGGFTQGPASAVDTAASSLLLKDINGDGKLDLFLSGEFSAVTWLPGDGNGGFGSSTTLLGYPSGATAIAVSDFNGDGHPELAVVAGGHVTFFRFDAGQGFQPFGAFPVPGPGGLAADFSGDGKPDLVGFTYGFPGTVWYLENTNCKPRRLSLTRNVSSCNVAGAPFAVQPAARLTDDGDNLVACGSDTVSAKLAPETGTPGAHLSGTISVPVVAGLAAFNDLSVNLAGRGYRLRLTHSDGAAVTSRSFSQSLPPPSIGLPADLCTGGIDRFEAAAGYDAYTWTLDGTVVGRSRVLTLSAIPGGTHSLQLSVVQDGCSASASVSLVPKPSPAAPAASSNSPVPFGGTLQLASTDVPGATYEWTGPNAFSSTDRNPTVPNVTPAASGTYRVVARIAGCSSSGAATIVKVLPAPLCPGCANPSFAPAARVFQAGARAFRTALRDFNGDGDLDVLVANTGEGFKTQVTVYPGDGRGGFGPGVATQFDFSQTVFAVADINRDGVLDLVLSNLSGLLLVPGLGDGRFGPAKGFAAGFNLREGVVGDFNEDGWADVAAVSADDKKLSVLLGDGAGGFLPAVRYSFAFGPSAPVIGDFNGDHHPDIAVSIPDPVSSSISILLGDGSGGFTSGPSTPISRYAGSLVVGDFDGNGVSDLAAGGGISNAPGVSPFEDISLFKGLGDGTFQFVRTIVTDPASSLRIMDINGDGKDDLVFLAGDLRVVTGRGGFVFDPSRSFPAGEISVALDIGDADRDGLPDAVVLDGNFNWPFGFFALLRGVSDGLFARSPVISAGGATGAMLAADFNRDGRPDLAIADSRTGHISIFDNDGAGGLAPSSVLLDAMRLRSLAAADFNGDGFPDLAATGEDSYGVSVYLNNGAGGFSAKTDYVAGGGQVSMAVADFNRDGKMDLAIANDVFFSSSVSILLGDGAGHFAFPDTVTGFFLPVGVVAGDFNGDGKPDIAVINSSPPSLSIALGDGAGGFGSPSQMALSSTPSFLVAGDFNLDGKLDVAVAHDRVSIFLGNGSGGFAAPSVVGPSGGVASLVVGDWNGDGKPDLSLTRPDAGDALVLNGDGVGGFASSAEYLAGKAPAWVTSADFNGDGRPDLGFASRFYGDVILLFNTNCVPSRLSVSASPSCPAPGQVFPAQPIVKVRDDGDNVVPCDSRAVTAGIASGTGTSGAVLGGTTSINAVAGVAAFTNLSINLPGHLYQLEFHHPVASRTRDAPFSVGAPPPAPAPSNNGPVCAGQTLTLSVPGIAGALYRWTGPNGFTSTLRNPSIPNVTVLASGTYSVTVTVDGCVSPLATTTATVIPRPTSPTASNNGPICAGQTLQLNASTVPGATYAWTGPGGFTSSEQNPQILSAPLSAAGAYRVTAAASGCASPQATTNVVIRALPSATISVSTAICPASSGSASVPSAGAGATYGWTIGNGTITSGAGTSTIVFTAGPSGSVQLDVAVTNANGCEASGSRSVSITEGGECKSDFFTLPLCRVLDTRNPSGPLGGPPLTGGDSRTFVLAGSCGIPVTAKAVSVNITETRAQGSGYLLIYPAGSPLPDVSAINFSAGQTRANNGIFLLGPAGDITVSAGIGSGLHVDFILDVNGYFQ